MGIARTGRRSSRRTPPSSDEPGSPRAAKRIAKRATSPKLIVPKRSSAAIHAVGRRRRDRPQQAVRDAAAVLAPEECRGGRRRPDAEPVDRHHLAALGKADHDRRDAGDVDDVALQHPERDPGRDAGVDRIAARFEDEKAGVRRRIMAGRDHVTVARQHAAMSRNLRSLALADHVNPPGSAKRRNVCAQPAGDNTARRGASVSRDGRGCSRRRGLRRRRPQRRESDRRGSRRGSRGRRSPASAPHPTGRSG